MDAALLGPRAQGFSGTIEVATITFQRLTAGDPQIAINSATARNVSNGTVSVTLGSTTAVPATPSVTSFAVPSPNPFRGMARLAFALARPGAVSLELFAVDGRRVRTLVSGTQQAGEYRLTWDGEDEQGHRLGAGVYYARLVTAQGTFRRTLVRVE